MSFDVPEFKSKRKGRINKEDPVLFQEQNSMATDADIFWYYEVRERLGSGSIINSNYWHNGRQIGYVEQQMVSFGHTSPQDKDNLRRYVKIELPKLEEQLQEKYKRNKQKEKEEREALREVTERAKRNAPSGFVKPTRISDELAKFLEKPSGSEMARTDVTREINKYIRTHNLQDKENGRKINPDSKLATLLKLKNTDQLTYFNLQRYMSHHFTNASNESEIRLKSQREAQKEEEEFERRFKEEEKEKRYQEFKKNKSGLGLAAASNEALPVAVAIAVPITVPTLVVESSSFALKNKLWVSGR